MNWETLTSLDQLEAIRKESTEKPVLIFKHSTRCSISRMVLDRLERNWDAQEMEPHVKAYFLDLISYRQISNQIADLFQVEHESPQVLIIRDGASVYDRSHMAIDYQHIRGTVKN
ncbi:bacillithiol system redox-active protein YtxJ [Dawidia soli]|uniref:Bacillithiol system redox-active protein YtxJ n=1 Tax=Dawidia soli TaxID=2782352 RepID=A0AAP2D4X9_9BACT|nr:bacillithiol system redox-active protein YtxJ [Dawidia soli]MBT1685383.1 bacillithiol system redox-active protein YtxJ [Dawidia soli]